MGVHLICTCLKVLLVLSIIQLIMRVKSDPTQNGSKPSDQLVAKGLPEAGGPKNAAAPPPLPTNPKYLEQLYSLLSQVKEMKPTVWENIQQYIPPFSRVVGVFSDLWNSLGLGGKPSKPPTPSKPVPSSEAAQKISDTNGDKILPADQSQASIHQNKDSVLQSQAPVDKNNDPGKKFQDQVDQKNSPVGQPHGEVESATKQELSQPNVHQEAQPVKELHAQTTVSQTPVHAPSPSPLYPTLPPTTPPPSIDGLKLSSGWSPASATVDDVIKYIPPSPESSSGAHGNTDAPKQSNAYEDYNRAKNYAAYLRNILNEPQ